MKICTSASSLVSPGAPKGPPRAPRRSQGPLRLLLAHPGSSQLLLAPPTSSWFLLAPPGSSWLIQAPPGYSWLLLAPRALFKLPKTNTIFHCLRKGPCVTTCAHAAWRSQGEPEEARRSQEEPRGTRGSQLWLFLVPPGSSSLLFRARLHTMASRLGAWQQEAQSSLNLS